MEEKHMVQMLRSLRGISTDFLVDFYNQYSGLEPVKKFHKRANTEEKVGALIKAMLKEKRDAKKKGRRP